MRPRKPLAQVNLVFHPKNDSVPQDNSQQQPSSDETVDRVAESKFEDEVNNREVDKRLESITTDKELIKMGQISTTTDPHSHFSYH